MSIMDWLLNRLVVGDAAKHTDDETTDNTDDQATAVNWADLSAPDGETGETRRPDDDSAEEMPPPVDSQSDADRRHSDGSRSNSRESAPVPPDEELSVSELQPTDADTISETATLDTDLLLTNLLGGLDAPTVMFDADGAVLRLNAAACELFSTTPSDAIGQPLGAVHVGSELATEVLETKQRISEFEESVDGDRRRLSRTVIPFEDESGAVVGGMEIARDITEITEERDKTETLTAYQDEVVGTLQRNIVAFANGDLTITPTVPEPTAEYEELQTVYEEYTEFNDALSTAIENFRTVIERLTLLADDLDDTSQELSANSQEVTASVEEINHSTDEIANGTQNLAEQTDQADVAVSSLTATIEEITASAEEMDAETSEASRVAVEAVDSGSDAVEEIRTAVASTDDIATEVDTLEQKMQEVGSILDVIFTIADQTNLLALNATIEAARAGEHGKGFAVVAEEVKKLATEAQESAADIETIITTAQNQTTTVSGQIDTTTDRVSTGADAVETVIDQLSEIEHAIEQTSSATSEVSTAVENQANSMDEMGATIETAASLSEELSASLQEISAGLSQQSTATDKVASRALELSTTSEELYDRIDRFRLTTDETAELDEFSDVESQV